MGSDMARVPPVRTARPTRARTDHTLQPPTDATRRRDRRRQDTRAPTPTRAVVAASPAFHQRPRDVRASLGRMSFLPAPDDARSAGGAAAAGAAAGPAGVA